ncbi:MAG TPA: AAA family ATPase [Bacteroidales bacterium]|nr:AAA family ATPase [Bacteroidales bacterium]HPM92281.1 AAA family ATPase [Bacteroidales bacterium]
MERLIEKSNKAILSTDYPYRRHVIGKINWNWKMNGIIGARGTGKTTLLLQKLKELKQEGHDVLYARLDDFYFSDHRLNDLADEFRKQGGGFLYLDEIHKYPGWPEELKNIYDTMPELKVVFSGSSIIDLMATDADLSRRALNYEMTGLSFREFLLMSGISNSTPFSLDEILQNHVEIAAGMIRQFPVLKYFRTYLRSGYYPYFLEPDRDYLLTLEQVIRTVMEVDMRFIENYDVTQSRKMLLLLKIIASSAPFKPNVLKISERTGLHRHTVLQYFHYLEKARMIKLLNHPEKHISRLQKPDKIFLENPNLFYALNPEMVDIGNLRETFVLNQLSVNHEVNLHARVDFMVDFKYLLEIGGKNKKSSQIKDLDHAFLFMDDIEIGNKRTIPIWLLGFLY